jgi:hypothetical protein
MRSFPNIGKSGFRKGEYVGYSEKAVNPFTITKNRLRGSYRWRAIGTILNADNRDTIKIIYAKDLAEMSKRLEQIGKPWVGWSDAGKVSTNRRRGLRKKRCWKGYEPVKGKRAYSKGSCRRVRRNAKGDARRQREADAFYKKDMGPGGDLNRWATEQELAEWLNAGYPERYAIQDRVWNRVQTERIMRAEKAGRISNRTARAMLNAGLPLSRSELRGNPRNESLSTKLRRKRAYYIGQGVDGKFSSTKSQIVDMLISKLSYLRNNRDENLESFLVRKRPKHSRDYIVILKHRKYVDGARVYSSGQKADGVIRQFATILGSKAKRVGQSDYVFTSYGIRFPGEPKKSSPGKLFPNSSPAELRRSYMERSKRYLVTKKFTSGYMKGATIVDESPVPLYVGFKPSKPYFGSPYIVTKTEINYAGSKR